MMNQTRFSASSSTSSPSTTSAPSNSQTSNKTAVIGGSVAAAVVVLIALAVLLFYCKRRRDRRRDEPFAEFVNEPKAPHHNPLAPEIVVQPSRSASPYHQGTPALAPSPSLSPLNPTHHPQSSAEALLRSNMYAHGYSHSGSQLAVAGASLRPPNGALDPSDRDANCLSYATDTTAISAPSSSKQTSSSNKYGTVGGIKGSWDENSVHIGQPREQRDWNALRVRNDAEASPVLEEGSAPPAYETLLHTPPPVVPGKPVVLQYPGFTGSTSAGGLSVQPASSTGSGVKRAKSIA
ncbi:hypothetical protein NMY22_g5890 [Coprinellus aureogranulatus]|nr:hypothetical protein NMY22_g5890 [Coprinellus aureogranulatus]